MLFNLFIKISIDYLLCYQNLKNIKQKVKNNGSVLIITELNYIKKNLISYKGEFNYLDFLKIINVDMSKQEVFKNIKQIH